MPRIPATSAFGRGCVKTHRADAPSNIDLSERSVFDYFSLRKGKRTPETETALRFYTASATTGRERLQHMLGTNFWKTGADHRAPPCRCYSFPDGYRIVLKRRVLLTQASRLVSLSESCS